MKDEMMEPLHPAVDLLPSGGLLLYDGPANVTVVGKTVQDVHTRIVLEELPFPAVWFTCTSSSLAQFVGANGIHISAPGSAIASLPGTVVESKASGGDSEIRGVFLEPFVRGNLQTPVECVVFHLLDFPGYNGQTITRNETLAAGETRKSTWPGRVVLPLEEWQIVIDARPDHHEVYPRIRRAHEHHVTHIGRVGRSDGKPITHADVEDLLQCLSWFFSFVSGAWSQLPCVVGLTRDGTASFTWCAGHRTSNGTPSLTWFDFTMAGELPALAAGFKRRWNDPDWQNCLSFAITLALHGMRTDANVEASIALLQTVLEALSWRVLVHEAAKFTEAQYKDKNFPAHEKFEELLKHCGIPLEIPPHAPDLQSFASNENPPIQSGPEAFTRIRNKIVHPESKKLAILKVIPGQAKLQAWALATWYIQLVILWAIGYSGSYSNCVHQGQVEPVPWAKP